MIRCKYVFKKVVCVAPAGYSMQSNLEHHHLWYFNVVFTSEKEYGCKKKLDAFVYVAVMCMGAAGCRKRERDTVLVKARDPR